MGRYVGLVVLVAVVALAVVLIRQHRAAADRQGWDRLADAREQGMSVESLNTARDEAAGSPAEPWIDLELALKLYDQGTPADLERALQITTESLAKFQNHPVAAGLTRLKSAINSFLPQAAGSGSGS